jgi:glycyl-tRNA synthetase
MSNKNTDVSLEDIVSLCKRRGFIFQGSEIYGGLAGTWDYGPLGVTLKKNLMDLWWKTFVEDRDDMHGVDAAILMNPKTWKASGHVDTFTDPLVECLNCNSRYRTDHLIVDNATEWFKYAAETPDFDEEKPDQKKFLNAHVQCENCGKMSWGNTKQFNMMFKTAVGPVEDGESFSYLRPETAQGIFTNFKNVVDTLYPDVPFGIAQQGKAFRNEISPRDFVFRSREFNQMEIEYFIHPDNWEELFEQWRKDVLAFLEKVGVDMTAVSELEVQPDDLAHYSKRTIDFEFAYPHGSDELLGLAYRTEFDLQNIQRDSGKKMLYQPKEQGSKPFVPHVIEPSFGVERLIMAVLVSAFRKDVQNGEERIYLALPEHIAPVKYCVSPLLKNKPELVTKAKEVYTKLKKKYPVMWDDNGNIGKRYRRQDEIGTPYCVVIDFDTLDDDTVTVRDRDTTEQKRVKITDLI